MMKKKYGLHGVHLCIEYSSPEILAEFESILRPYAINATEKDAFLFSIAFGPPPQKDSPPAGLRCLWKGILPDGLLVEYYFSHDAQQRVTHLPGHAKIETDLARRQVRITLDPNSANLLLCGCLIPPLIDLAELGGWQLLHAATFRSPTDPHRAIVLAGPSGCGKSTTSLALALSGLKLMGDDISFLSAGETAPLKIWGLAMNPKAHHSAWKLLPALNGLPRYPAVSSEEYRVSLPPACLAGPEAVEPETLLLLQPPNPSAHRLEAISTVEAIGLLARDNVRAGEPIFRDRADRTFRALARLVRDSRKFKLSVGPDPASLLDYLQAHGGPNA